MDRHITLDPATANPSQKGIDIGFRAYSLMFDNGTGQWWYVPQSSRYVPAYQFGQRMALEGITTLDILAQTPPGQFSIPIAGEKAEVIVSDKQPDELTGMNADIRLYFASLSQINYLTSILANTLKPNYFDRANLISQVASYQALLVPNHGLTQRWTYTVPTAKAFFVEYLSVLSSPSGNPTNFLATAHAYVMLDGQYIAFSDGLLLVGITAGVQFAAGWGGFQSGSSGLMYIPAGSTLQGYTDANDGAANASDFLVSVKGLEFTP